MAYEQDTGPGTYDSSFAVGIGLNLVFVIVEAVFGILSNSLALIADAGHNLGDVLALALAWGATMLGRRHPTPQRTYGWGRSTVLAALVNAFSLLLVTGGIAWEALRRLADPAPVGELTIIWVGAAGVIVNGVPALLFFQGRKRDLNIRGAFLHLASDAGVSLGVIVAGIAILATGWLWVDPMVGLLIAAVILLSAWGLLRDSLNLALDAVPRGVDVAGVRRYLASLPDVADVHDLHIWGMSTTETALSAHLVMPAGMVDDALLVRVVGELRGRFGIEHSTLQIERGDPSHPCPLVAVHPL